MTEFIQRLLRLKACLGVPSDKDVAALLDMSKQAFAERKKRNSFPEDKLLALKVRRPDLYIDFDYVLTGQRRNGADQSLLTLVDVAMALAPVYAALENRDMGQYQRFSEAVSNYWSPLGTLSVGELCAIVNQTHAKPPKAAEVMNFCLGD